MKKAYCFLLISCCFIYSCRFSNLPYNPSDVDEIIIGTGLNEARKDAVILKDDGTINAFMSNFTFGGKRDYTVKHQLQSYVEFHLANGKIAHLRFEKRIMRYGRKEYMLSKKTAQSLKAYIKKDLSNKAL